MSGATQISRPERVVRWRAWASQSPRDPSWCIAASSARGGVPSAGSRSAGAASYAAADGVHPAAAPDGST